MIETTASVPWEGQGKKGAGQISTETGALESYPYGFASRFQDDRSGTNPEEILGAAHAACFTMAFAFACDKAGLATTAAKRDCPLSKALASVPEISLQATLRQAAQR